MKITSKGFTLIEMLVVIAIISILIGIGVNTFTIAQKKARDTRRKADLHSVQVALEAYATDHNGIYPAGYTSCGSIDWEWALNNPTTYPAQNLVPTYIASLPHDPVDGDCNSSDNSVASGTDRYGYEYQTSSIGTAKYILIARLENSQDPQTCDSLPGTTQPDCPFPSWMTGDRLYYVLGQ